MKSYFAYIRVSTQKQGSKGVSLQEQRSAIEAHAEKTGLAILEWFEERETAAKTGRTKFTEIMKRLKSGEAAGLIVHKIDRSARNLKDWAALGELIDSGVDVQIASESYDLSSRGGRLSADIQAVIAADYIRNLREETIKGMTGRLKQGLYPLRAPIGYLDTGGGNAKAIDPIKAPLVRQAFELYASGKYSLQTLATEMEKRGIRSLVGKRLHKTAYSKMLNNPFYSGTILVRTTGATYKGIHEPIITKRLYREVQQALQGKVRRTDSKHAYIFARCFRCKLCSYSLVGERQKGHVYYRCHTKDCETKGIREEELLGHLTQALSPYSIKPEMFDCLRTGYLETARKIGHDFAAQKQVTDLALLENTSRLERLTDLYIDGQIASDLYLAKKKKLEASIEELDETTTHLVGKIGQETESVEKFLEQAEALISSAQTDIRSVSRDLLEFATSNRTVCPNMVGISINPGWLLFLKKDTVAYCGQRRDRSRT